MQQDTELWGDPMRLRGGHGWRNAIPDEGIEEGRKQDNNGYRSEEKEHLILVELGKLVTSSYRNRRWIGRP